MRSLAYLLLSCSLVLAGTGCSGHSSLSDSATSSSSETIVATYGDSVVTLSAFEEAYRQSNTDGPPASDSIGAYQEFLERYLEYHLKRQAALDAGLDEAPAVQQDLRRYRHELARPEVMRSEVYEPVVRTLYERQQEEVDVSHILLRVEDGASPKDTMEAYTQMQGLIDSLHQGRAFDELAYRHSEDPSSRKQGQPGYRGRIGYLKAGQVVEPFERRMYELPPDSVSDIFRTQFGYHVLKVHERRPSTTPMRLSHIMLRPTWDTSRAHRTLDSLRSEIVEGRVDFATVAREHSEDAQSASQGGDLGRVESLQGLPPSFQRAVGALDTVGTVSDVVESQYGFHLLQLTDREDRPSLEDAYPELRKEIADRPRVERRKWAFAREVRAREGTSVDTSRLLRGAQVTSLDTLARALLSSTETTGSLEDATVAALGDSTFSLQSVAHHVMQTDGGARLTIGQVLDDFLNEKALRYAAAQRALQDSSIASTLDEYRDGFLVYQFMEDSVWTAAAQDEAGLRQTYEERTSEYQLPARVRTITLRARADSFLVPYQNAYSESQSLSRVVEQARADSQVTTDTLMVTDTSPDGYQQVQSVEDGGTVGPIDDDGTAVLLIRDTRRPARTKTFEEARSEVVQDYQERYEEQVMDRLRRRYDAETYPDRLKHAFQNETAPDA